jgi:hypothetical protein
MPWPATCAQPPRLVTLAPGFPAPGWRNWQTRRSQKPLGASPWGFDPPSRHHFKSGTWPSGTRCLSAFRPENCVSFVPELSMVSILFVLPSRMAARPGMHRCGLGIESCHGVADCSARRKCGTGHSRCRLAGLADRHGGVRQMARGLLVSPRRSGPQERHSVSKRAEFRMVVGIRAFSLLSRPMLVCMSRLSVSSLFDTRHFSCHGQLSGGRERRGIFFGLRALEITVDANPEMTIWFRKKAGQVVRAYLDRYSGQLRTI